MEPDSSGSGGKWDPLPPPREARRQLRRLSLETVKTWADKFGPAYRKLELACNYLRQVRKVDFGDAEARWGKIRRMAHCNRCEYEPAAFSGVPSRDVGRRRGVAGQTTSGGRG